MDVENFDKEFILSFTHAIDVDLVLEGGGGWEGERDEVLLAKKVAGVGDDLVVVGGLGDFPG